MDITLQTLTVPELAGNIEPDVFVRQCDGVIWGGGQISFLTGASAGFDTWANLFNLTNWEAHCALDGLWLQLTGTGRFFVKVFDFGTDKTLLRETADLTTGSAMIDFSVVLEPLRQGSGMMGIQLVCLDRGRITCGGYLTRATHARDIRLALGITTFRREAAVEATAHRLTAFLAGTTRPEGGIVGQTTHVFVIDNGQSADIPVGPHISHIPNVNLGGAGGFARALAAAQDDGFTHCLFMDDDASFPMENLTRTHAFLRLAHSPRAAMSGAMIASEAPWALWESGATFDTLCCPQFGGTNLCDQGAILMLEQAGSGVKPDGFYGGWWYFAFPIEGLTAHPFPFFVRGDDSSFSLANKFDFATMNGVVSFQDDFGAKETPLVHYLDLRYHIHHPLVHERLGAGKWDIARMAARMILRQMVRMHYGSAAAQLQAWRDVMKGPEFFETNADMMTKRPEVAALGMIEAWEDGKVAPPTHSHPPSRWRTRMMIATLNGHLLPFFGLVGGSARLGLRRRSFLWPYWGKARVTIVDISAKRSYVVRHSKRQFFALLWQLIKCLWRWNSVYAELKQDHKAGYKRLATPAWWRSVFAKGPQPLK